MFFWLHTLSSIIACVFIVYLSLSCRFKFYNKLIHKWLGISVGVLGLVSLVSSLFYGFSFDLRFEPSSVHVYAGFASLILSELPFLRYVIKSSKWHYRLGDFAAFFALVSLITGFIAYWSVLLGYFSMPSSSCILFSELNSSSKCFVAVDGVVYDMTSMPRWQTGSHFDYSCGGNYSLSQVVSVVPSHSAPKYFGPVIGNLC